MDIPGFDAATRDEIQNLIKAILEKFTIGYVKHYALGLVKKAEEEAAKEPGPDWKLTPRPEEGASTDPLKTGFLQKKGAIRKSWKKRYLVVHPNYVVEYFENEKAAQGPKPKSKGKMHLAGYRVVEDPNAGIVQQLQKLAEQMKIDISELPKPKQYPETVLELHHSRRRCYYIEAATLEEKKEWMEMFRTCCYYAWGLENRDPVHVHAFYAAIRDTRWHLGRWGWWSYGGSETQLLSDMINDEIEYQTIGKIYSKLPGPWVIKSKLRDQVLKAIDGFVSAGVAPAWAAMSKTVEELRPKAEPLIAKLADPLGKQKAEIINKLKEGCMSIIKPLLEQHVVPHLKEIMDIIKSPVVDAYKKAGELLEKQFTDFSSKFDISKKEANFGDLDRWSRWSWWEARPATDKIAEMYDPLWLLHKVFPDIYPWSTIYNGQDQLRKILDNAVYTFEVDVKNVTDAQALSFKPTITKYEEDAKTATTEYYLKIFKDIIMPFFNKLVIPACKTVIEPLSSAIPDELKQFVDPEEMFDKLVDGVVEDTIKTIIK
jgi:hypothetical protein